MLESLSTDELEFVKAIEKYKAESGKLFPPWSEVLRILKDLGYRKTASAKNDVAAKRAGGRKKAKIEQSEAEPTL